MSFWAYMLHCRGGVFYTGHTDNLPRRIAQHEAGAFPGFTADRLPVTLVWNQEFPTRIEALEAERRIKGWSRVKKMALIRGDWDRISSLAKGKNGPSTSSGRTEREMPVQSNTAHPELVEGLSLICHPDTPSSAVRSIQVSIGSIGSHMWRYTCSVEAEIDDLKLPASSAPLRKDGLWQSTCFELFVAHTDHAPYLEFNLSPSTEWAAYSFRSYRDPERQDAQLPAYPIIAIQRLRANALILSADIYLPPTLEIARIALSAVIEETDGTKSYWALRHPPGKPDFHHPDCFQLMLGAPPPA